MQQCELCTERHPREIWRCPQAYVIDASDDDVPGFIRVISTRHVAEMTDLAEEDARVILRLVLAVEGALRRIMQPDKVNLASLGNMVPHVHWHVIARYRDDAFFPNPIWGPRLRASPGGDVLAQRRARFRELIASLPEVCTGALQ